METNIMIAGFWRRVGALFIDVIFVFIVGFILGLGLQTILMTLGKYAVLFGFVIVVGYLTIFNSRLVNGQTLGKSAFEIQVADKQGNLLGVRRSLYRALLLATPFFIIKMPIGFGLPFVALLKNVLLQAFIVGLILIYIFNKENRQSLHDLLVGSYVVSTRRLEQPVALPFLTRRSLYISGVLVILFVTFSLYYPTSKSTSQTNPALFQTLSRIDGAIDAEVEDTWATMYGKNTSPLHIFEVTLWVTKFPANESDIENMNAVKQAVKIILESVSNIERFDLISITFIRMVDSGFFQFNSYLQISKTPRQWKDLIYKQGI
jgi:uncharacterized RDD family membrane protein YckC